ncbi:rod shape-determining protein MreD [Pleionea litopenaei]|uniref:Rod shape-determining protein MreD n=1 Tax=Pleionea litopenaei TaxID=3070815 RepID=A0AA51X6A7_9GAMM|nr:rod shape-determining protein MreD [Pleionea sp. HL-JVS1]WMS87097.1 rod shape-determining protein MreD [Pleionea sp. HL-JVS1]
MSTHRHNYWVIWASFAVALLLDILPLPKLLMPYWPEWLPMVMLYWTIALPHRVGIFTAFIAGIFVDAVQGSVLGLHAMSLSVMAYFSLLLYQRIRLFPRWKQSLVIAMLVGIYMLLVLGLKSLFIPFNTHFSYWIPMFSSGLVWSWLFLLLRDVRRQLRVS